MVNQELGYSISGIPEGTMCWLDERRQIIFACRFQRRWPTIAKEED
jgi:hypothetical protein